MGEFNILRKALHEPSLRLGTTHLVYLLAIVAVIAYWPAITALWAYWIDEPYLGGHGPLVAALAVWLIIRARTRIEIAPARPAPWALVLLVPCCIGALVFWKAGIQSLHLLMLPILIWLGVLTGFGMSVARLVAVPIGYLYFSMPCWNLLTVPLQHLTVRVVALVAPAIGLPAAVSGTAISFPSGATFIVTMACSGVGFLTQGLAVAALLGELEAAPIGRRLRLMASMAVLGLATNWLRVTLLLVIGYWAGMDNVIVAHDHLEFGYVLFVVVLVSFVWFATRGSPADLDLVAQPKGPPPLGAYLAAIIALAIGPILTSFTSQPATVAAELNLPAGRNSWSGPFPAADGQWQAVFVGPHAQSMGVYFDANGRRVEALVVGYLSQGQGRELVNEENSILGTAGLSAQRMAFTDAENTTYLELEATDSAGNRSVIWSVYDIGGKTFVVPLLSQLWYGIRTLARHTYSAQIAFRTRCVPSCDVARETLRDFIRGVGMPQMPELGSIGSSSTGRLEEDKKERS